VEDGIAALQPRAIQNPKPGRPEGPPGALIASVPQRVNRGAEPRNTSATRPGRSGSTAARPARERRPDSGKPRW
jgi:hypothetical protein